MKVAIVHDYLNEYGGAEKVVNAIHEMYPGAPIYTAVKNEKKLHEAGAFLNADIRAPRINGLISPIKKFFIFSYPIYFETLNLQDYDLVISSTAHFAKGIRVKPEALHVSYIHTPPRFLWGYKTETSIRDKWWAKPILVFADIYLRMWDYAAAQRPDYLITNSKNTLKRINKFYKRDAKVIYPFYDSNLKESDVKKIKEHKGNYYFTISRKGKFKNLDLIAKTFTKLKKTIYIAGSGSLDKDLKRYESKYVKLLGFLSEEDKVGYLKGCKGFVLATENEDFGITPLEAMSFGKPVIALNSGGFKETVTKTSGVLFDKPTVKSLSKGIKDYETRIKEFKREVIKKHAAKFSKANFQKQLRDFIGEKIKEN